MSAPTTRRVALLFPGQGAQRPGTATGLYHGHPGFRRHVDEVFALWGPEGDAIRADWLTDRPAVPLDDLRRAQPLLFAIGWGLGRTLLDDGPEPVGLLGHSVGEVVAATLADVLSLPDAVRVLRDRLGHLADAPPGGMLAVAATPERVRPYLGDGVVVGAVNGPGQLLLAGPETPLAHVEQRLRADAVTCRRARSTTAFHSPSLAVAAARAEPLLRTLPLRPPRLPLFSCYTGRPMTAEVATDPTYWAAQPAAPVQFGAALDALLATAPQVLVEAGAPHGLTALARRHPAVRQGRCAALAALPAHAGSRDADLVAVATARTAVAGLRFQEGSTVA
ncbi:acyltransferase domain-containing protein [Micromonospora sp. NPDC047793]|uniref:acyltransferase domain-containing protein n=1 Tax=Micromonospora sp. NPDC047793 TaxID=3154342 RepID=UPI0033FB16BE